jgi:hypothetical protein
MDEAVQHALEHDRTIDISTRGRKTGQLRRMARTYMKWSKSANTSLATPMHSKLGQIQSTTSGATVQRDEIRHRIGPPPGGAG